MGRNEVRDNVLFLSGLMGIHFEKFYKPVVCLHSRFHHAVERSGLRMFRSNFQISAYMVINNLTDVSLVKYGQIKTNTGGNNYFPGSSLTLR